MIKKSILALSVAAISAPLFAQEANNVTIYGTIAPSFEHVRVTDGAGNDSGRNFQRIADQNSLIGFKGQEFLGNGLKAVWQIETAFDVSGNTGSSLTNGNTTSGFGTRNTYVGLSNKYGTVLMGRYETPYRLSTKVFDPFSGSTGDAHAIMGKLGGGHLSDVNDFYIRTSNTAMYMSPKWEGLSGNISYSANEDRTKSVAGLETANTSIWSMAATYERNNWLGTLAYEHRSSAQGGWTADVEGIKAGVGYAYVPGAMVGLVYERLRGDDLGTAGSKDERDAWGVSIKHPINNFVLKAQYTQTGKYKDETGTLSNSSARMYSLGADYNLSKRTSLFAHYIHLDNKSGANYNFTSASTTATQTAGADSDVVGVGIKHSF